MKLLLLSDTHGHHPKDLPDADVLVHAGDWSSVGAQGEHQKFFRWVDDVLTERYGDIVVVPGNHDRWAFANPQLVRDEFAQIGVTYLEDCGATIQGRKFYGMPWSPIFGRWAYMCDGKALGQRCSVIPDDVEVLITHCPPYGFRDAVERTPGNWMNVGSPEVYRAINRIKPKLHCFGHIHEGHGEEDYGSIKLANASIMDRYYRPVNSPILVEIA